MKQKRDTKSKRPRLRGLALAVAAVAFCFSSFAGAEDLKPAVSPAEAKAILMRMAEFMARTQTFSVDVTDNYDVYQKSGQKIDFGETRKITVARPDGVRVEVEESDGDKNVLTFDGRYLTIWSPTKKVYAQISKPGSIDDAVVYFVRDLGMRLPFALLLLTTAPEELEQRTRKLDYVEKTSIHGTPAHHLAGRTDSGVDYQFWIADGDKPLLLRLVLTYTAFKGQPEFRAQFSDWNLAPVVATSMFAFNPPPGAQQIAFLAQLPRSALPGGKHANHEKLTKSGGQK